MGGDYMISALLIQLTIGLIFIGIGLPGFINPRTTKQQVQMVYGIALVLIAIFGLALVK